MNHDRSLLRLIAASVLTLSSAAGAFGLGPTAPGAGVARAAEQDTPAARADAAAAGNAAPVLHHRGASPVTVKPGVTMTKLREAWFVGRGATAQGTLLSLRLAAANTCPLRLNGAQVGLSYTQDNGGGAEEIVWTTQLDSDCAASFDLSSLDPAVRPRSRTHVFLFMGPTLGGGLREAVKFVVPHATVLVGAASGQVYGVKSPQAKDAFTVVLPAVNLPPTISALDPDSGPVGGRTTVTLTGANFHASDVVVFAGAAITGGQATVCGPAGPASCTNKQTQGLVPSCEPGELADFLLVTPGQLQIVTQCVGLNGAGAADVFVVNSKDQVSNALGFTYGTQLGGPELSAVEPPGLSMICSDPGVCRFDDGYDFLAIGSGLDECASLILVHNGVIHELLPDPNGNDRWDDCDPCPPGCGFDPGALCDKPAGCTPCSADDCAFSDAAVAAIAAAGACDPTRPDLVPYPHSEIVQAGDVLCSPFVPGGFNQGAFIWVNEGEMRLLYGPPELLGCDSSDYAQVYVSNDPGTGLAGDAVSNPMAFPFVCELP